MSAVIHPFICSIKSACGAEKLGHFAAQDTCPIRQAACSCIDTRPYIYIYVPIFSHICDSIYVGFRVHCECAQQSIVPEIPTRNERDKSNKCASPTSRMTSGFLGARIYSSASNIYVLLFLFHPTKLTCVL